MGNMDWIYVQQETDSDVKLETRFYYNSSYRGLYYIHIEIGVKSMVFPSIHQPVRLGELTLLEGIWISHFEDNKPLRRYSVL